MTSNKTARQLWRDIMYYEDFDRMPVLHWGGWNETYDRWRNEGMAADCNEHEYFNTSVHMKTIGVNLDLFPLFEEETTEETDEYRVFRDGYGVVQKEWKAGNCIPHFMSFTFQTASNWDEYKKRLQPDPGRIPDNLDEIIADAENSDTVVAIFCGSLMGWIRNWMGLENMSYLMFDSRDTYIDIIETLSDLACWGLDQVLPKMKVMPDMGHCWEDMCGKAGPLLSPNIFESCVSNGYTKIRNKLEEYGIDLLSVDSDGDISLLTKPWLDCGVNVQMPLEIGTWRSDPMEYRKKFGKDLRIIGGYNKLELEKDRPAIDAELEQRIPLMKEGGYIVMPDHLITPDTPLENYKYYLEKVRALRF